MDRESAWDEMVRISSDGRTVSGVFPKVTASRGGIKYHWEKDEDDSETLIDVRKQLARKVAEKIAKRTGATLLLDEITSEVEDGLISYAALLMDEIQERVDAKI